MILSYNILKIVKKSFQIFTDFKILTKLAENPKFPEGSENKTS